MTTGAVTYGHRFLATSGRAGPRRSRCGPSTSTAPGCRSISSILAHAERRDRIARELEAQGAQARRPRARCAIRRRWSTKSPIWSSFPAVVAGFFERGVPGAAGGSADDDADPPSALLPGARRDGRAEGGVPRRHQHAAAGRAGHRAERRARRHRAPARRAVLLGRRSQDRRSRSASTACTRSSSTRSSANATATRRSASRRWRAGSPRTSSARPSRPTSAATAARLAQDRSRHRHGVRVPRAAGHDGRHLRARSRGCPRPVWKAIYYHYLPHRRRGRRAAVAGAARARRRSRGPPSRSPTSSTRSSALFRAGEKPTGSRDPFGLRRQAHGVVKILVDLPELTGVDPDRARTR